MVMFLSNSFLNLTVWTPEMAFTTVDLPWATWPMVPGRKRDESKQEVLLRDRESDVSELHTNVDSSLSADDLWGERGQGGHVLLREHTVSNFIRDTHKTGVGTGFSKGTVLQLILQTHKLDPHGYKYSFHSLHCISWDNWHLLNKHCPWPANWIISDQTFILNQLKGAQIVMECCLCRMSSMDFLLRRDHRQCINILWL